MVILIDGNCIAWIAYSVAKKLLRNVDEVVDMGLKLFTGILLENIIRIRNEDQSLEYINDIVITIDSETSWRKRFCETYKESVSKRDEDRKKFFYAWRVFVKTLPEHMPIKVLQVYEAEGDDIIGVLSKFLKETTDYNVVVISEDRDFIQLFFLGVKLWSPLKKRFVVIEDVDRAWKIKVLVGDRAEGISGVKKGVGQKTAEKLERIWSCGEKLDEEVVKGIERNKLLMEFDCIPTFLKNSIILKYRQSVCSRDAVKLRNFLVNLGLVRNWTNLINSKILTGVL